MGEAKRRANQAADTPSIVADEADAAVAAAAKAAPSGPPKFTFLSSVVDPNASERDRMKNAVVCFVHDDPDLDLPCRGPSAFPEARALMGRWSKRVYIWSGGFDKRVVDAIVRGAGKTRRRTVVVLTRPEQHDAWHDAVPQGTEVLDVRHGALLHIGKDGLEVVAAPPGWHPEAALDTTDAQITPGTIERTISRDEFNRLLN